ncbi:MAG TPA: MFS transporter [Lacunisphaera sp.]
MPRLPPWSWINYAAGVNPAANLLSAPKPPAPAARAGRSPALALAGLSLAVLLSTLNTSIVNVALPTLTGVFHASTQAAQWAVISFVLAITTLIVGVGRLADIVGRKRLLLAGIALFTAAAGPARPPRASAG